MAYKVYTTRALVLGGTALGEANIYLTLLTEEFGLVRAIARSVREEKSKLRPALSAYTLGQVSLVRGRDVWRITGAKEERNFFSDFSGRNQDVASLARITSLLKRLLAGEEENTYLFTSVVEGLGALAAQGHSKEVSADIECVLVLRILYALGYLAAEDVLRPFFADTEVNEKVLLTIAPIRAKAIREINKSLSESHL